MFALMNSRMYRLVGKTGIAFIVAFTVVAGPTALVLAEDPSASSQPSQSSGGQAGQDPSTPSTSSGQDSTGQVSSGQAPQSDSGQADNTSSIETPPSAPGSAGETAEPVVAAAEDTTVTPAPSGEAGPRQESDTTVTTGDAVAGANAVNVADTNMVNGDVDVVAINSASSTESIDTRPGISTSTENCAQGCADARDISAAASGHSTTTNSFEVAADTGSNAAAASCGDATITTGNAYAGANIVNIVNSNIVNGRLIAVAINQFGDWSGDLILPGRLFFESLMGTSSHSTPAAIDLASDSAAGVTNSLETEVGTGDNVASSTLPGTILTGDLTALSNVVNVVNANLIGGGTFVILLNIGGEWTGAVYGMPTGGELAAEGGRLAIQSAGAVGEASALGDHDVSATTTAAAQISNSVILMALSGGNAAEAECGSASIFTGDAEALANILNIANTNIIGRNLFLALVNIGGNWTGNLAFGRPDLWVLSSASLQSPEPLGPGMTITYTLTLKNRGDGDASNVVLSDAFHLSALSPVDAGGGMLDGAGNITWDIGTLRAGEAVSRDYTVRVTEDLPLGDSLLTNTPEAESREPDANPLDNADTLSFRASRVDGGHKLGTWAPVLEIEKTNDATGRVVASSTVKYKIRLKNIGAGPAYNATVFDEVTGPLGKVINSFAQELGEIFPGEEILFEYDILFDGEAAPGAYTNTAFVEAYGGNQLGYRVRSPSATSLVEVMSEDLESATSTFETLQPLIASTTEEMVMGTSTPGIKEEELVIEPFYIEEPIDWDTFFRNVPDALNPTVPEAEASGTFHEAPTTRDQNEGFPLVQHPINIAAVLALGALAATAGAWRRQSPPAAARKFGKKTFSHSAECENVCAKGF